MGASASSAGARCSRSSPTSTAVVAVTSSGHHLLKVGDYSRTKGIPTGQRITSRSFVVGGRSWHIIYYPNGSSSEYADYISVYLVLGEDVAEPVKAQVGFSFIGETSKQEPSHIRATTVLGFDREQPWGYPRFIKKEVLEISDHLKDNDCLVVRCDVTVIHEFRAEEDEAALAEVPPSDMRRHFGDLLKNKEGADVTFEVGGETFAAHRCVLAARSPVFKAELFSPMEEGTGTRTIRVEDMEAEVFGAVLSFIYTDSLPETEQQEVAMAQHLLVAADRYDLERLKLICEDKLCTHVNTASVATTLALAEQHHCHRLKKACFKLLSSRRNLDAVMATEGFEHLYRSCPGVMKELMSKLAIP